MCSLKDKRDGCCQGKKSTVAAVNSHQNGLTAKEISLYLPVFIVQFVVIISDHSCAIKVLQISLQKAPPR